MEIPRRPEPPRDDPAGAPRVPPAWYPADPAAQAGGSASSTDGGPDLPTQVAFVNAQHGTTFRIGERYLHGEQGAVALYDNRGARFVMKWTPGARDLGHLPEIVRIVDGLRSRWYPVPRYVAMGLHPAGRYVVQTALPGAPLGRVSPAQLDQLLALNDLQRGMAPPASAPSAEPWPARVVRDTLDGGAGYCLLDPMREHSPTTARLLGQLQDLVANHRDVVTPTDDVVHFDWHPMNVLALNGKISGVVDWDSACSGDRAFDLATLLFYVYDREPIREALWQRLAEIGDPEAVALYLAHMIHRLVDWSICYHAESSVEKWLGRAHLILSDLPPRTGCEVPAWP